MQNNFEMNSTGNLFNSKPSKFLSSQNDNFFNSHNNYNNNGVSDGKTNAQTKIYSSPFAAVDEKSSFSDTKMVDNSSHAGYNSSLSSGRGFGGRKENSRGRGRGRGKGNIS